MTLKSQQTSTIEVGPRKCRDVRGQIFTERNKLVGPKYMVIT